jgi:2-methylcitrate dehydratase
LIGITLHTQVKAQLADIKKIVIRTHESAIRIIAKTGSLANATDRDHCLQYMIAVPLIFGSLTADHYEDGFHEAHPIIDELRDKMEVIEDKRSIANAIQVFFKDGSSTEEVVVEYPVGHRRRREEWIPLLELKFKANLASCFPDQQCQTIFTLCKDNATLEATPVNRFMDLFVIHFDFSLKEH